MTTAALAAALLVVSAAAEPSPKAVSLFRKALQENEAGNYGAALKMYFDAHKEDAEVLALDDEGLLHKASIWLDEQLAADDNDIHAHFQMAELKMLQGLERQALGHYRKVVSIDNASALAKMANPLIKNLEARVAAAPKPKGSSGGGSPKATGGSSGSAANEVRELQNEVTNLQNELTRAKSEIKDLRRKLSQAENRGNDSGDVEKLQREFDEYKKEAEEWRRFRAVCLSNPAACDALSGR
jgi:tetratricopeptide (TPR) repeat protein